MNRRLSRQQWLQWLEDYYHGRALVPGSVGESFIKSFDLGVADGDLRQWEVEENNVLNLIEERYVEPEQMAA